MIIKTLPYFRKDTPSTLLVLSAATLLLLLISPLLLLFNVLLLQPVQAQNSMSFRTPTPADGSVPNVGPATMTFDAHGTSSSDPQTAKITNGTFQITSSSGGQNIYSGPITSGTFTNNSEGGALSIMGEVRALRASLHMQTSCSTSDKNVISAGVDMSFTGPVECSLSSSQGGAAGGDTTQSMAAGSTQDTDRDGISDSSDKCPHNSNTRCYKEG